MIIIHIIIALLSLPSPEGLRSTAPTYLDSDAAREHMTAATLVSAALEVDRDLVLSIAHHESRYDTGAIGREAGRLVSCGVMTPYPTTHCPKRPLLAQYLDGARHLRVWIDACENDPRKRCDKLGRYRSALLGYAGGWRAITNCTKRGVIWIRPGVDGCKTPDVFTDRARDIRRASTPNRGASS